MDNLTTMFTDVNDKVGTIAGEVGRTPSSWNSGVFSMIENLSENVMIPIAGMIISAILCYELITMVMDKNNMHEVGSEFFFRYLIKACIAVLLLSYTFDITMAIFDVGNHIVTRAGGIVSGSTTIDVTDTLKTMFDSQIDTMGIGELIGLGIETMIVSLCMKIISLLITVMLFGRMIEIYLYISVAPVPFATFSNREWGGIGNNYIKGLCSLAFQGFFIMVCVAIYAIEQCFTCLNKAKSPKWVLEGDIKGCFDNISHEWILNHIPMDRDILRKWLKSGYVETGRLFPTDLGSPQGSAISPTICNMVLDGLEVQIRKKYHKTKRDGKAYFPKVNFIRYADDFIVTGESRELLEAGVLPIIREFLSERGLELSEEKTVITHIEDGFDFLGCNIRWYKGKLLTKPSKKNYKAIVNKIRGIIKQNPSMKQEDLIRKLNPVIRGWVNFQKYNVSSQAFDRFDFDVWRCLWRWCKRRHPKKSHKWIAKKYFRRVGTRNWTFSVNMADSFELHLIYATDTKIVRWLKTKSEATPFDERFTEYFEDRDTKRMLREINGRKKLNALYKMQKGICPHCGEPITVERGFRIHTEVGADFKEKNVLLHADCHRKLHYSKNVDELVLLTQGL